MALLELMGINDVDNSGAIATTNIVITITSAEGVTGTDIDGIISLRDIFGLNLETSFVVKEGLFVGIGDHFVTGEYIDPNSHVLFCI